MTPFLSYSLILRLFCAILNSVTNKKRQNPYFAEHRSCLCQYTQGFALTRTTNTMITVLFKNYNYFSQNSYDLALDELQLHTVKCTCGKSGCLIRYGHYRRYVIVMSEYLALIVQRVRCKECGTSHALLPSFLVPYSQVPLADQQDILKCLENGTSPETVMERNLLVDENNVKYIIRQFRRHWEQRILSLGLSLKDSLVIPSLTVFSRQFMQIHRTRNILLSPTNTS